MNFKSICNEIAINVLKSPGTLVECMDSTWVGLEKGKIYNVIEGYRQGCQPFLSIKGFEQYGGFYPTRFRKVEQ